MATNLHRQNFNVDADQASSIESARVSLGAQTVKDTVMRAVRLVNVLAGELGAGRRLVVLGADGVAVRIVIPDLETSQG